MTNLWNRSLCASSLHCGFPGGNIELFMSKDTDHSFQHIKEQMYSGFFYWKKKLIERMAFMCISMIASA